MKEAEAIEAQMKQKVQLILITLLSPPAYSQIFSCIRWQLDPLVEQHITEVKLNQERRKAQVIPAIQQLRPQPQAINMAASQVAQIHKV